MQNDPKVIDHNPYETRPTNRIWWVAWIIVALLWFAELSSVGWSGLNWTQICLGGMTFGLLASWAIEVTGNKVPDSWMGRNRAVRKQ